MQSEKEKMIAGLPYDPYDEELKAGRKNARRLLRELASIADEDEPARKKIFRELFGQTEGDFFIENPFICDYGYNIFWGENAYANFNCIFLDAAPIHIGKNVMLAPAVKIFTATHPIDHKLRNTGIEYAKSITIKDNVWIGGGAIINPGVTIGENTVIGSGSVVTKDIPANVVAVGNPCTVIREIE
ncbi:MAG: sugar O-acetyltransferase [Bacteroidota bacterium]